MGKILASAAIADFGILLSILFWAGLLDFSEQYEKSKPLKKYAAIFTTGLILMGTLALLFSEWGWL